MPSAFWTEIDRALDRIEAEQPDTFDEVAAILNDHDHGIEHSGAAFFAGGGGDRTLMSALLAAGWRTVWAEAWYYYVARHPATGETLTYCEGDVYPGDVAIR